MKLLFFIFILMQITKVNSQLNHAEKFYFYKGHVYIQDSLEFNISKHEKIEGAYSTATKRRKTYSISEEGSLKTGESLTINTYNDSTILISLAHKSKVQQENAILTQGELEVDFNRYQLKPTAIVDDNGEDAIIVDTLFYLTPKGLWSIHYNDYSFFLGEYKNGKKDGDWHLMNAEYSDRLGSAIIKTFTFKEGVLISERQIDISHSTADIQKIILGEWYNIGFNSLDIEICKSYKCSLIFTKDKSKFVKSFRGVYDYLNLKLNRELETSTSNNCGVNYKTYPTTENNTWKIDDKRNLNLQGNNFKVEYLSKDVMIISY